MNRSHDHSFGQDRMRPAERRTFLVIAITLTMMAVEIAAGISFGSMALLADGLHMASHTVALGLAAFAYVYARRRANDERYSFGTGKVNALAGFTGAVALAMFAAIMLVESVGRFLHPVAISFDQAILVAVLGLLVNGASMFILGGHHEDDPDEDHHHDHNLRSAYLHVLADALTSLLAIFALLAGKYFGAAWLDPMMGVLGAGLVIRWAWGLLRQSGHVLLDRQAPEAVLREIRAAIESTGDARVYDLHVWSIGPGYHAAEIGIESDAPLTPDDYRERLPGSIALAHVTIEVSARPVRSR